MHLASIENMQRCIDWYLPQAPLKVVDLGSYDVNGSYRKLLPEGVQYVGCDLEEGPGVDLVLEEPYSLPLQDSSVDVVLSGQMLEHCPHCWRIFTEVARILKPGGLAFMIAPSAGPVHRYPVDCYRFYPDAYDALAEWGGLRVVHCWLDERGPWRDLVGVFQKGGNLKPLTAPPPSAPIILPTNPNPDPAVEAQKGVLPYRQVLARIHALVRPGLYFEIGVRRGRSLALCQGDMIGVDPHPDLDRDFERLSLHRCTSDDFFFFEAAAAITQPIDLAFIDGMHLLEFVYRDFMNVERYMSEQGVLVIDDVLPNHPLQASRRRRSLTWTGDVWRIVPVLQDLRPDLKLTLLDTAPSGLLLVSRLNPKNRILGKVYNTQMRRLLEAEVEVPVEVLGRTVALPPEDGILEAALERR